MIQISRVGTKNMLTVLIFTAAPCVTPPCLVVTVHPLPPPTGASWTRAGARDATSDPDLETTLCGPGELYNLKMYRNGDGDILN